MSERNRGGGRSYRYFVIAVVLVLIGLSLAGAKLVLDSDRGSTYQCIVGGPHPAGAARPDVVTGELSYWPLGRSCEWAGAAGEGTITTYSGSWPYTIVVAGLLLTGAVLALAKGSPRRRHSNNLRLTPNSGH